MKMNNVAILNHTLKILEKGYYITKSEKRVNLKMNRQQMKECIVYFPDEIHKLGKIPRHPMFIFQGIYWMWSFWK